MFTRVGCSCSLLHSADSHSDTFWLNVPNSLASFCWLKDSQILAGSQGDGELARITCKHGFIHICLDLMNMRGLVPINIAVKLDNTH